MGAVWLVFLYFPGRSLSESESEPLWLILGWIGLVSFGIVYVTGFVVGMGGGWHTPTRPVITLFFVALGCALLTIPAIGWNSTSFLPFLMAYAAYGIGAAWHWWTVGISVIIVGIGTAITISNGAPLPWLLLGIVAMMAVVNTINIWLISRSVAADELRMDLATSEERESIARDVHDLLGHSLTVVKLKAELAARLIDRDPDAARAELAEISRITGEAITGVRSTVTGLRTHSLAEQLELTVRTLASASVSVNVEGKPTALSPVQAIPAAWILREATTNILRHAHATSVSITIKPGMLVIEDDGIGFSPNGSSDGTVPSGGNGVSGMRERAVTAGAVFTIEPVRNTGTKVSVTW